MLIISKNVKTFAKILSPKCGCGRVVSFNVPKAAEFADLTGQEENIREYIRGNCGCVGKIMNMYSGESHVDAKSITCAHIKMRWIKEDVQKKLLEGESHLKNIFSTYWCPSGAYQRFGVQLSVYVGRGNWLIVETNGSQLKFFSVFSDTWKNQPRHTINKDVFITSTNACLLT